MPSPFVTLAISRLYELFGLRQTLAVDRCLSPRYNFVRRNNREANFLIRARWLEEKSALKPWKGRCANSVGWDGRGWHENSPTME